MHLRFQVWQTLNKIQKTLNLTDEKISDMMRLTPKEFKRLRAINKDPNVTSAMAMVERLNIGFESLILGTFDYNALAQHYFGNNFFVPDRYSKNAFSKKRVAIHFLNFIEENFSWEVKTQILRNMQLHQCMFLNPDENISLRFSVDVSDWLYKYCGGENTLYQLGQDLMAKSLSPKILDFIPKKPNLHQVYESIFGEIIGRYFEKNYKWWIQAMNHSHIIVRGIPTEELFGQVETKYSKSKTGCLVRMGIFSVTCPL